MSKPQLLHDNGGSHIYVYWNVCFFSFFFKIKIYIKFKIIIMVQPSSFFLVICHFDLVCKVGLTFFMLCFFHKCLIFFSLYFKMGTCTLFDFVRWPVVRNAWFWSQTKSKTSWQKKQNWTIFIRLSLIQNQHRRLGCGTPCIWKPLRCLIF